MKIIINADRPGWAFHSIAKRVAQHLTDHDVEVMVGIPPDNRDCDLLIVLWWNTLKHLCEKISYKHLVTCVYDHVSWNACDADKASFQQAVDMSDGLVVCNQRLQQEVLHSMNVGSKPVYLCEDGVDVHLFRPWWLPEKFTIGWAGVSSVGHANIKGLDLIAEAAHGANVEFACMDACNCGAMPQWYMPSWMRTISTYVNASATDGTPNPPLEAMACGRPVISTRVGLMPQVINHNVNGLLCDRTVESLTAAIRRMRDSDVSHMGMMAWRTAQQWSWTKKVQSWRNVLEVGRQPKRIYSPAVKKRPKGLLVADVRGWAFDVNERDCANYLQEHFDFDHYYVAEKAPPPATSQYDFVFVPYHRWCLDHYWGKLPILGSLRSQDFVPNHPRHVPEDDAKFIQRCAGFHVCYEDAYLGLKNNFPNVVYLTNPVDMRRFPHPTQITDKIICEWNGNAAHGQAEPTMDIKGIHHIIKPAVKAARVALNVAEFNTARIPPHEMAGFYARSNVCLCASEYEAASNSVMEAMAMGLAVICTDVGNHREMQKSQMEHLGSTGIWLVERTPEAFAVALAEMTPEVAADMGRINREEIVARWSWDVWAERYADFFRMAL